MADPEVKIKEEKIEEQKIPTEPKEEKKEILYFRCSLCDLNEAYDYMGMNPSYTNKYVLLEDSFVIEDPFLPPRTGQFIILGSICTSCKKSVCKDPECSVYFDGTFCMRCAKENLNNFPKPLQDKINKTVLK